jgi:nitrate/nitrite transporter NarK
MLGELWSLQGRCKALDVTRFAFFLTFAVWFNLAPLVPTVKADMVLSVAHIRNIAIRYVALSVAARVLLFIVGAGFVIGIGMVAVMVPAQGNRSDRGVLRWLGNLGSPFTAQRSFVFLNP